MKTREDLAIHIPNGKFFEPDVNALLALSEEEMRLIYGDLFEWTEDANWPVARILIPLLGKFGNLAAEHIRIAEKKDSQWLAFLMYEFLDSMPQENLESLKPFLLRLATAPTEYEIDCGCDYAAKEKLNERLGEHFDLS